MWVNENIDGNIPNCISVLDGANWSDENKKIILDIIKD